MAASASSPSFPPSSRERLALILLSFGAVAVVLAAAPYKAFDLDRYFVSKELVLNLSALLAILLLFWQQRRAAMTRVDLLLSGFLLASLVSAAFAINYWAAQRALAISFSGVALFWAASAIRRAGLVRPLLIALATGVVVGTATCLAQAYGYVSEYFSLNRSPGGTFGNRNFVAHLAAVGTPIVVLVALTARTGIGALLGGLGMAIVSAALVLSRSRAAWLAVIVLAVPVGGIAFLTRARWREPRTARRLVVLGATVAVGGFLALVLPNRLEWKSDSPYLDSAVGLVNYKQGSGRGRLVQYTNSLRMTRAHPVFGVGPGNWPVVYPKYASRNDPSLSQDEGLTSNPWPSSDWVAFLSERGVIGFGLLLAAMFGLLGRAVRDIGARESRDPEGVLTAIALVGTLAATAVVGAFDAVLLLGLPAFFFWTLAGALVPPAKSDARISKAAKIGAGVMLVVVSIGVLRSATQLAAMGVYSSSTRLSALEQSASLDPGNYRIRIRLAQAYAARGDCTRARAQARAARDLFPNAGEPKRILVACGAR